MFLLAIYLIVDGLLGFGLNLGPAIFLLYLIAMALISPFIAESDSRSHRLDEDDALDLLERTLKSDSIYEKRILSDCIAHGTEETTNAYFGFSSRNP